MYDRSSAAIEGQPNNRMVRSTSDRKISSALSTPSGPVSASMEAYRSTFRGRNDIMLLEPNSDFLRYFRDSMGKNQGRK